MVVKRENHVITKKHLYILQNKNNYKITVRDFYNKKNNTIFEKIKTTNKLKTHNEFV